MSAVPPPHRRTIVLKADRETLVLLAGVVGLTLAIGHAARTRAGAPPPEASVQQTPGGEWAGRLAALVPGETGASAPAEAMSSEAMTLPKTAMALPATPKPSVVPVARKPCDGTACAKAVPVAVALSSTPPRTPVHTTTPHRIKEASLMSRLNPLNVIPDVVKRPFASAGDVLAGWVRRF